MQPDEADFRPSATSGRQSYSGSEVKAGACKSAAAVANKTYGGSGAYSYYPCGCYLHVATGDVYYNTYTTGAANVFAQRLCAGAAQGTPVRHSWV